MAQQKLNKNLLSILGLIFFLIIALGTGDSEPTPDLKCNVSFDGSQFTITNNDIYTWKDCRIKVNGDYKLIGKNFSSKQTYTVGSMQFTNDSGERFNPYTHKVSDITFYCENPEEKRAFYYGAW